MKKFPGTKLLRHVSQWARTDKFECLPDLYLRLKILQGLRDAGNKYYKIKSLAVYFENSNKNELNH